MKRLRICLGLLGLLVLALGNSRAQENQTETAEPTVIVLPVQTPEQMPATTPEPPPPSPPRITEGPATPAKGILLNFKDASLDSVMEYLSEVAGFSVVRETPVEGRITVMSRQPLSVEEAVSLLNMALKEKGYAAIALGRTLKIVPLTEAKKRNIPVRMGNDPAGIEPTDTVVTQIIPVKYVDVTRLKQDLAPLIPSYAELAANASSNSLILTDTQANIRRIVEIVRALDTTMATVAEVKVFSLKYATAANTARLINELFRPEQTTGQAQSAGGFLAGISRVFGGRQPTQPSAATGQESQRAVRVIATADDRSNTVVVSAPSDTMRVIEEIVKELESSQEADQAVFIYSLKNGKAKNLETVLNNLFGARSSPAPGTATRQTTTGRTTSPSLSTTGLSPTATQTAAGLAGQVYVVANEDTNSLMVMTATKNFDTVKEIIDQLDRPVPQVLIKVLIAEVTTEKSLDLGAEFSVLNLTATGHGMEAATTFGKPAEGGLVISVLQKDLAATLAALQKLGKLDVLSRPYILSSDNQAASITVGQRVPFITNTRTTETGQTINTIQYQDIGIILRVTPHINPDGLVILDVNPEISALTGTTVPISETVKAPVFAKRSATSRVAIRDGQTIVIGGLMEDKQTEDTKKVPGFGDIPLLKYFFRRSTTEGTKTELLIFLTPHVAAQPDKLQGLSSVEVEGSHRLKKAVTEGTFDKHLELMQKKPLEESQEKGER
ncbi:MAG: type II secretion system secretin GspD [Candidatus Omnitrophica bacterium]|nr:type II secretion system secretin GspD [Candidatus Omnitrophota bacterium]